MVIAQAPLTQLIREQCAELLDAISQEDYDHVWHTQIDLYTVEMISFLHYVIMSRSFEDKIGFLQEYDIDLVVSGIQLGAGNFHIETLRGLFKSLKESFLQGIDLDLSMVVTRPEQDTVALLTTGGTKDLILPFRLGRDGYVPDLEALFLFSREVSSEEVYSLGMSALEANLLLTARRLFSFCGRLRSVYDRMWSIMLDDPFASKMISPERHAELVGDYQYILLAEQQANTLRHNTVMSPTIDVDRFMKTRLLRYEKAASAFLTPDDLNALLMMPEATLRSAVSKLVERVEAGEAVREAAKPHSGYEISDLDFVIQHDQRDVLLSMPIKSGPEMVSRKSVPSAVFHQVLRPHLNVDRSIVIFVTVRPCSQALPNYIAQVQLRFGVAIGVIEDRQLAGWLKVNGLLR